MTAASALGPGVCVIAGVGARAARAVAVVMVGGGKRRASAAEVVARGEGRQLTSLEVEDVERFRVGWRRRAVD